MPYSSIPKEERIATQLYIGHKAADWRDEGHSVQAIADELILSVPTVYKYMEKAGRYTREDQKALHWTEADLITLCLMGAQGKSTKQICGVLNCAEHRVMHKRWQLGLPAPQ